MNATDDCDKKMISVMLYRLNSICARCTLIGILCDPALHIKLVDERYFSFRFGAVAPLQRNCRTSPLQLQVLDNHIKPSIPHDREVHSLPIQ